jgi:transcriptional regulator with XRE-family HTH domain
MSARREPGIPPGFWDLPAVRNTLDRRDLGGLFALIAQHCGISQHALGAMVGMPQPQVWHYIHDRHKPTLDTIARVADRLAIPARPSPAAPRAVAGRHRFDSTEGAAVADPGPSRADRADR